MPLLVWRFFKFGYPCCCEAHARHYCMVIWDIGDDGDVQFKMSLS